MGLDHHDCCQGTEQAHDHRSRRVPLLVLYQGCHEERCGLEPYDPPSELRKNDVYVRCSILEQKYAMSLSTKNYRSKPSRKVFITPTSTVHTIASTSTLVRVCRALRLRNYFPKVHLQHSVCLLSTFPRWRKQVRKASCLPVHCSWDHYIPSTVRPRRREILPRSRCSDRGSTKLRRRCASPSRPSQVIACL